MDHKRRHINHINLQPIFVSKENSILATLFLYLRYTFVEKNNMNDFSHNRQRVSSLIEDAMLGKIYDEPINGDNNKPKTNVVIHTNRLYPGKESTISAFLAIAYDGQGNKVDSMKGFFLEPKIDFEKARIPNSDTAIMSGGYEVIPKDEMRRRILKRRIEGGEKNLRESDIVLRYDWYIDNPPGRSGIAIHGGNSGENTTGCYIPGVSFSFDEEIQDYTIQDAGKKRELFDFFNNYGCCGIKINVGPHFEELYK